MSTVSHGESLFAARGLVQRRGVRTVPVRSVWHVPETWRSPPSGARVLRCGCGTSRGPGASPVCQPESSSLTRLAFHPPLPGQRLIAPGLGLHSQASRIRTPLSAWTRIRHEPSRKDEDSHRVAGGVESDKLQHLKEYNAIGSRDYENNRKRAARHREELKPPSTLAPLQEMEDRNKRAGHCAHHRIRRGRRNPEE